MIVCIEYACVYRFCDSKCINIIKIVLSNITSRENTQLLFLFGANFFEAIFVHVYLSAGRGRKWDLAEGTKTKIANFPVSHVPEFLLFFSFFLFFYFLFFGLF